MAVKLMGSPAEVMAARLEECLAQAPAERSWRGGRYGAVRAAPKKGCGAFIRQRQSLGQSPHPLPNNPSTQVDSMYPEP